MNYIKVLGASGSKTKTSGTTSFQVFRSIIVDAGNVINTLGEDSKYINHILLTHSHFDHIADLPYIIESYFEERTDSLTIYGLKETIAALKKHYFNNEIWPDFSKINILHKEKKAIIFKELQINEEINIHEYSIKVIKANHIEGSCGYAIIKNNDGYLISGDTIDEDAIIEELNNNKKIKSLIIECSFPKKLKQLAIHTKHFSTDILADELKKLKRNDIQIFLYHLKPLYTEEIKKEVYEYKILRNRGKILEEGDVIHIDTGRIETDLISHDKFEDIMEINRALSSQLKRDELFEMILSLTRKLTKSEAGTLYIKSKDEKKLDFTVIQNDPLSIFMGGTKETLTWPALDFYLEDGSINKNMVAIVSAYEKKIINIDDVYQTDAYEFSGTKKFDKSTGYRSKSMLVIPLINHEDDVIGVLQLINKIGKNGEITSFNVLDEKVLKALASQAAMALTNVKLIESLEDLLNAFLSTIAKAVDAKSPYTTNHIQKVEKLALLIAKAINDDQQTYKNISYNENDYRQIQLAAWVHDIGKISMPEHIIDKSTKLEGINDRIHLIEARFELLKKEYEIDFLKEKISKENYLEKIAQINKDIVFIKKTNIGGEYLSEDAINNINRISKYTFEYMGLRMPILLDHEIENLSIKKGTLSAKEKEIINGHAKLSLEMLKDLPFPKKYNKVVDIACNHHEKLNGKGYPRGLTEKDLSLEDKIMVLADIFEALTASDRPYKDAKKLSEVLDILKRMINLNEIDGKLVDFFFSSEALQTYINEDLKIYQNDIQG